MSGGENTWLEESTFAKRYELEWNQIAHELKYEKIQSLAISGNLKTSFFRSMYWKILLDILPPCSPNDWIRITNNLRNEYNLLVIKYSIDPHFTPTNSLDNPLSQKRDSVWFRYLCDLELKKLILQDINRTYPEEKFFQNYLIKCTMNNILFIYARKHPTMCYRQGMNELLAPVLFVLNHDHEAFQRAKQLYHANLYASELFDPKFLEQDAYWIFTVIMDKVKKFYEIKNDVVPTADGNIPDDAFLMDGVENTFIGDELNSIEKNILAQCDPQLYSHLKQLNISFTLFGIRWLRLLYGREFVLEELLFLWDVIFSDSRKFTLVNYILVAMLVFMRNKLLNSEYNECLNYLMKYPDSMNIKYIVQHALYFQNPEKFQRPVEIGTSQDNRYDLIYKAQNLGYSPESKVSLKEISNLTKRFRKLTPYSHEKKLNRSSGISNVKNPSNQAYDNSELKHLKVVMSLCKLKLEQYHKILEECIPQDNVKAQEALTGIHELSGLMDVEEFFQENEAKSSSGVDMAYEASTNLIHRTDSIPRSSTIATGNAVALCLPPPQTDVNMTVFKYTEHEFTGPSNFPSTNPLKLMYEL